MISASSDIVQTEVDQIAAYEADESASGRRRKLTNCKPRT